MPSIRKPSAPRMCPNGHVIPASWEYCVLCNASEVGGRRGRRTCPSGHEVAPGFDFCPTCGAGVAEPEGRPGVLRDGRTVVLSQKAERPHTAGWIVPLDGPHEGESFTLFLGRNVLGTAPDCAVVMTDPLLRAHHCEIEFRRTTASMEAVMRRITGSGVVQRNGVDLGPDEEELIDNDFLRLGGTEVVFKAISWRRQGDRPKVPGTPTAIVSRRQR